MAFVRLIDGPFRTGTGSLPYFVRSVTNHEQYVSAIPVYLAWQ